MIELKTDFPYLDKREYVHGTTIFSAMLDLVGHHTDGNIMLKNIKFKDEIKNNGVLLLSNEGGLIKKIPDSKCQMVINEQDKKWEVVYQEKDLQINKRINHIKYSVKEIENDGSYSGKYEIIAEDRNELIKNMIQANKELHINSNNNFVDPYIVRLGYIEKWNVPSIDERLDSYLHIKNLIKQQTDNKVTTINRLEYTTTSGKEISLTVGFNMQLK